MSILVVLLTLVLGFSYAQAVPYEKIKLKRSNGWEAYVYLAKHGLFFLAIAVAIVAAILAIFFISEHILSVYYNRTLYLDYTYKNINFSELNFNNIGVLVAIYLTSLIVCEVTVRIKKSAYWATELKKEDSVLKLLVEAIEEITLVKISLKSRKVYVGLIDPHQLGLSDLENIVIIPFMSGYRDKDKLRLEFDCSYMSLYEKNELIFKGPNKKLSTEDIENLKDFKLVVRMDEIESISLFNPSYYEQFEFEETKVNSNTLNTL